MKQLDEVFHTKLYEIIEQIEKESDAEIVVYIRPASHHYFEISLSFGLLIAFLAFTFFIFYPVVFGDLLIYTVTVLSFFAGTLLCHYIRPLQGVFLTKEKTKKQVEIMARAAFQKGGIHHTKNKTGVLFYASVLEKQVYIVADREVLTSIPPDEWEKINHLFNGIFKQGQMTSAFLLALENTKPVFAEYVPASEEKINELADDMEIDL